MFRIVYCRLLVYNGSYNTDDGGYTVKDFKNTIKSIVVNVVSSIIFQIITLLITSSGVIYIIRNTYHSVTDNHVTISLLTLCFLIICIIILTLVITFLIRRFIRSINNKKYNYSDIPDYYFSDYEKNLTIYNNGTGIIIHKFTVIINNVGKFKKIRRKLNIEDGIKTAVFPSLQDMQLTKKIDRFHQFGFWYKADEDIISGAEEYYWNITDSSENKKAKNNPQEIRWVFQINKHKVKVDTPYQICYVISVPGLAALENGLLNKTLLNDPSIETCSSNMHVDHRIQKLRYIISFEEGIEIGNPPKCECKITEQDGFKELDISGKEEYDLLYKRYIFEIDNPEYGSDISVSWKYNTK